jgi:hypothetical protein
MIKYGSTGFVDLKGPDARKFSELDDLYWAREFAVLSYLYPYDTDNIIKYKKCAFATEVAPKTSTPINYLELVLPKFTHTLLEYKLHKDQTLVQFMLDILSAVKFLHSKKIIHRDLKPTNIMVDIRGGHARATLIDFSHSIKRRVNQMKLDKHVVTYTHRAPELFGYKKGVINTYNSKVDVWSIGIILAELIIGREIYNVMHYSREVQYEDAHEDGLFMREFDRVYYGNCRYFEHNQVYKSWINKMLTVDSAKRISAEDMYAEILNFAIEKKMSIVLPKNGEVYYDVDCDVFPKEFDAAKHVLFVKAKAALIEYSKKNDLQLSYYNASLLLKYLIACETITAENYRAYTMCVCLLVAKVIYDGCVSIKVAADICGLNVLDIENGLVYIIIKHSVPLFCISGYIPFDVDADDLDPYKVVLDDETKKALMPNTVNTAINSIVKMDATDLTVNTDNADKIAFIDLMDTIEKMDVREFKQNTN